ncbi:MAG: TolC family protein [Phycisphaerae bacterium]|nr:TolC family protein [Phycisphaerae bacterium]
MLNFSMKIKLAVVLCTSAIFINGCSKDTAHYKDDADKEVYSIIDNKWQDDFGPRTNYKIEDALESPNDTPSKLVIPSGKMSLEDAVYIATVNNRRYQAEKEAIYLKALDLTLAAHQFAPRYFSESGADYAKNANGESIDANGNIGLTRLFATGGYLTTDVAFAWADILTGDLRSGLSGIFQAAITKPLLRDSERIILLENLTQAQRDTLYQLRLFGRFRKELTVSVITAYYNALLSYEKLENARQNLDDLKETFGLMEKMVKAGRLEKHELEQTQQDILKARDIFIRQQNLCNQTLDEFKLILSIPPSTEISLDTEKLSVIAAKNLPTPAFTEEQAVAEAVNRRLDLLNQADMISDAERKIKVAAEAFKARLDLTASTSSVTKRTTSTSAIAASSTNNSVGLELDLALDRKAERNQYRKALIALDQAKRNYQESSDITALQVRTAFRNLTEASTVRDVQLKSLKLAADRFNKTSLLLQYARSNTRDILDAQKDLFDAKNAAAEALVAFTIATLDFYKDAGVMEIKEDGMWNTKHLTEKSVAEKTAEKTIFKETDSEDTIVNWLKKLTSQ